MDSAETKHSLSSSSDSTDMYSGLSGYVSEVRGDSVLHNYGRLGEAVGQQNGRLVGGEGGKKIATWGGGSARSGV